jgi:hypothetical protein
MQLADVVRNYDWVAPRYDRWTDLIFGRLLGVEKYREQTIDLLGPLDGATVLDIGCGTGRNFPILVPRLGASGRIAIMDFGRARPDRGPLHWLYPLYTFLLTRAGIDSPEDLNDAALRRRWRAGRQFLRDRLAAVHEETYLYGGGLIIAGQKPHTQ